MPCTQASRGNCGLRACNKLGCPECGGTCRLSGFGDFFGDVGDAVQASAASASDWVSTTVAYSDPNASHPVTQPAPVKNNSGPNNDAAIIGAVGQGVGGLFNFLGSVLGPKPQPQTIVVQQPAQSNVMTYGLIAAAVVAGVLLLR